MVLVCLSGVEVEIDEEVQREVEGKVEVKVEEEGEIQGEVEGEKEEGFRVTLSLKPSLNLNLNQVSAKLA